jgi:hypothetical protein
VGGGRGGNGGGEHRGPVRAEHTLGEKPGKRVHHEVFADDHGAVIGVGGGVARDAQAVRAPVVDQVTVAPTAGLAAHPAVADGAVQAGAELVAVAGAGGQHLGVSDVAVPAPHALGGVPGGHVDQGGVGGLG